jgi:hypothetical protein
MDIFSDKTSCLIRPSSNVTRCKYFKFICGHLKRAVQCRFSSAINCLNVDVVQTQATTARAAERGPGGTLDINPSCVKADFQSSHEAPRSSLRVLASN